MTGHGDRWVIPRLETGGGFSMHLWVFQSQNQVLQEMKKTVNKQREEIMSLLKTALTYPQCVLSVMGDHAGEKTVDIFHRKAADIQRIGKTFWLIRSPKAKPEHVQRACGIVGSYVIFIEPSTRGGARPTTTEHIAVEYSEDSKTWQKLPEGLSPVTGKIDKNAYALVFDQIEMCDSELLDLWDYGDFSDSSKPVRFIIGASTVCAIREETQLKPEGMKSRYRRIIAIGKLARPYGVYLR